MHPIYLDFNSTAPLLPEAVAAMADALAAGFANPASQHAEGRRAHRQLEDVREEIARLLGANLTSQHADRLIFTSGGTEANNLALLGITGAPAISLSPGERAGVRGQTAKPQAARSGEAITSKTTSTGNLPNRLIISTIEHPSITVTANFLAAHGWQIDRLRATTDGVVDLAHLDELLSADSLHGKPQLVSVMLANNETGVIQPLAEIVSRCSAAGVPVHTDAAQAAGKLPIDFRRLGVAAMTIAPHKFGGPRGIGALVVRHDVQLQPILHGGAQQFELRPGTESIDLAVGFLAALSTWQHHREEWTSRMETLRDRFEAGLLNSLSTRDASSTISLSSGERAGVRGQDSVNKLPSSTTTSLPSPLAGEGPGVRGSTTIDSAKPQATDSPKTIIVNGSAAPRLPHTSNIAFPGHDRQALLMALDLAGICCSTGSACASGSSEPSPTLLAMNLPRDIVNSSVRFSLGPTTTEAEIDEAARRIVNIVGSKR